MPAMYPQTSVSDWGATRTRIVSQTGGSCSSGNMVSGFYVYPFAPNTNYDFEQALISKIQILNQAGTLLKEQQFTYQRLTPGVITIKALRVDKTNLPTTYAYGLYSILARVDKVVQTETTLIYDDLTPTRSTSSSLAYGYNATQSLSTIELTNSDGVVSKTEFVFARDLNIINPTGHQAKIVRKLKNQSRQGELIEKRLLTNGSVNQATYLYYDSLGTNEVWPTQIFSYTGTGAFQNVHLSGSPQQLLRDSRYVLQSTQENFNIFGIPSSTLTKNRTVGSVLLDSDKSTPAALISNARPQNVVFSDFENSEDYQLTNTISANFTSSDIWSGRKSYILTPATPLSKTNRTKAAAANYRFRCRAKATTGSNITVTLRLTHATSGWQTTTLTYLSSQSGKWILFDQLIPVSQVASNFTFQIEANAALTIDDVVLHPENSSIESMTMTPLLGQTSQTDNRGVAVFYEFDWLGRLTQTRNTDKHLVQAHTYRYQVQANPIPNSGFSTSSNATVYTGTNLTFTATDNCITGLDYAWKVDGIASGNTQTLSYTFLNPRDYEIQLTVSHVSFGSSTTTTLIHVNPQPFLVSISGNQTPIQCLTPNIRTYTASLSGCYNSQNITCNWWVNRGVNNWQLVQSTTGMSDLVYNFNAFGTLTNDIYLRCEVISSCKEGIFDGKVEAISADMQVPLAANYFPCAN